jgi:hypothetical protein
MTLSLLPDELLRSVMYYTLRDYVQAFCRLCCTSQKWKDIILCVQREYTASKTKKVTLEWSLWFDILSKRALHHIRVTPCFFIYFFDAKKCSLCSVDVQDMIALQDMNIVFEHQFQFAACAIIHALMGRTSLSSSWVESQIRKHTHYIEGDKKTDLCAIAVANVQERQQENPEHGTSLSFQRRISSFGSSKRALICVPLK